MEGQLQHTTDTRSSSQLLRRTLRANAFFSGGSGLLLALAAEPLVAFLGWPGVGVLRAVGIGLMLYGAELAYVARRQPVDLRLAMVAVVLDALWVVGSVFLLLSNVAAFTVAGKWAVALVADVVALFAVLQYVGIRRTA